MYRKKITKEDVEALIKALEVGNSYCPEGLKGGGILKVEPLPNFFFAGTPTKVKELSTSKVYKVYSDSIDSEGMSVTIKKGKDYIDLEPGSFEVYEVLSWNPKTR